MPLLILKRSGYPKGYSLLDDRTGRQTPIHVDIDAGTVPLAVALPWRPPGPSEILLQHKNTFL